MPCNLEQLEPLGFIFNPSSNFRNMFKDLTKHIEEFVTINNEYVNIKIQEEKAKVSELFHLIFFRIKNKSKPKMI
jgi:hypothetical protein